MHEPDMSGLGKACQKNPALFHETQDNSQDFLRSVRKNFVERSSMSLLKPNDVLEESWLLFFPAGLLGLRVTGPRSNRWISYLYAIFLAILHCVTFFLIRESVWRHYESLREAIRYFEDQKLQGCFSLIFVPAIIFSSIFKSSENLCAYKKLQEIDRVLSYLNSPIDHEIEMRKEVVWLCVYVLTTGLINFSTYLLVATPDCGHVFNISFFINFLPAFLQVFTICALDIFVEKIRVRFEQINGVIQDLLVPGKISVILAQSTDINNASKLRLARRAHLELHDAASAMNEAYGLRLFLIFFATVITVLNYLEEALNIPENDLAFIDFGLYLIWTCFHLGKYFHLATSCRASNREAKLAGGFFLEARLTRGSDGLNEEARALSRQLINRQLQFTVSNILSIDFPKGLTVLIAVVTGYFLLRT